MTCYPAARRYRDRPHARVYHHWLNWPAWKTLSIHARCLLVELLARYRPDKPNSFSLSNAEAARWLSCAENTAAKAISALAERKWITIERGGSLHGARGTRSRVVSLNTYLSDVRPADIKSIERWRK